MKLKSIKNEKGVSIIGILVALVIVALLAHPKYSPFRENYFGFLATSNLKKLHKECRKLWAFNISSGQASEVNVALSADVFTSRVKGGTEDSGVCTVEAVSKTPYNFSKNSNVTIEITDGAMDSFQATAKHSNGEKSYKIDAAGIVD